MDRIPEERVHYPSGCRAEVYGRQCAFKARSGSAFCAKHGRMWIEQISRYVRGRGVNRHPWHRAHWDEEDKRWVGAS